MAVQNKVFCFLAEKLPTAIDRGQANLSLVCDLWQPNTNSWRLNIHSNCTRFMLSVLSLIREKKYFRRLTKFVNGPIYYA